MVVLVGTVVHAFVLTFIFPISFDSRRGTQWGHHMYLIMSQGAQNYEEHNALLNLILSFSLLPDAVMCVFKSQLLSQWMEWEFPLACCAKLLSCGWPVLCVRWLWPMKNFQLQPDLLTTNQQTRSLNIKYVLRKADNSMPHHFDK